MPVEWDGQSAFALRGESVKVASTPSRLDASRFSPADLPEERPLVVVPATP